MRERRPADVTLAVVGATGGIGSQVVAQASAAGHPVRALARRPHAARQAPGVTIHQADVLEPATLAPALQGVDLVLCCVGSPAWSWRFVMAEGARHLAAACASAEVPRLAMISSIGVGDSAEGLRRSAGGFASGLTQLALSRAFRDLEQAEATFRASPRSVVIVRPTLLVDGPATGRWHVAAPHEAVASPIARPDVAAFLVSLALDHRYDGRAVTLGRATPENGAAASV